MAYDLKRKIHAGESILGVSVPMTLTRDEIESVMDGGSYDFVWVDGQHTPYNEDRLVAFCTAAAEIRSPRPVPHQAHQERLSDR